jgi:hypothetical protein
MILSEPSISLDIKKNVERNKSTNILDQFEFYMFCK